MAQRPKTWAVTGAAGFIGSNLLEHLLKANQRVVGFDNFVTGHRINLDEVQRRVTPEQWGRFRFVEGDICQQVQCDALLQGVEVLLHQAALGSVPLSLEHPDRTHDVNVTGFVNMLQAARRAGVRRMVYASSCAVYGDDPGSPKVEERIGNSISPYATSKRVNELYADVFGRCFGLETIGLRYFNVFGPRQDPHGAYAAVIPKWVASLLQGEAIQVHGDGETSRDFVYVADIVQANLLAATTSDPAAVHRVYNVGSGAQVTLNQLFTAIRQAVATRRPEAGKSEPVRGPFRPGDIRFSLADISAARRLLRYEPGWNLERGLADALEWYVEKDLPTAGLKR